MANSSSHLMFQLHAIIFFVAARLALSVACFSEEMGALIDLRRGLDDPGGRLASWAGDDCCSWAGVGCDDRSGRVVRLDLRRPETSDAAQLTGVFSSSTLFLKHLGYLDLSGNDFQFAEIPPFLGSFRELGYLNLSGAAFSGTVPSAIGNLSGLRHLDLSSNPLSDDVDGNVGWMRAIGKLPSLELLSMSRCHLSIIPRSLPSETFISMSSLDLSGNDFNSTVPDWVFSITSLKHLDLSANSFQGPLPSSVGRMSSLGFLDISHINDTVPLPKELGDLCSLKTLGLSYSNLGLELVELGGIFSGCVRNSLEVLDLTASELTGNLPDWLAGVENLQILRLRDNLIHGSIPESLGALSSLHELDISSNRLNGTIAESFGRLTSLVTLLLSQNSLNGVLSEAHFANLTKLKHLDLNSNSLGLNNYSNWIPPFRLHLLDLASCHLGPQFPHWLQFQTNLTHLDMSEAGIADTMPDWFWSMTSRLNYLDLSINQISARMPASLVLGDGDFVQVYLHSNNFYGPVPRVPPNVGRLRLSNNSLSGRIPASISDTDSILEVLALSTNNLAGMILSSVCRLSRLLDLDVSSNHLSGDLPDCWSRSSERLQGLHFSNNSFSGTFPSSICRLPSLITLHLRNSGLTGELPSSLKMCTQLITLDLSFNHFTGEIPAWMGENLPRLTILSLRSNLLSGNIPPQLSQLSSLQILDLSRNNLSGSIPGSLGSFSAMKAVRTSQAPILPGYINFDDYLTLSIKGMELSYDRLLSLLTAIDLSDNSLSGNIPVELGDLAGLLSLNLSTNHLTGEISEHIGKLTQLMSLDLSRNVLSGAIPSSLGALTFMGRFNLSYNALSGEIPSVRQFLAFADPSIYVGNKDLCGFPLSSKCGGVDEAPSPTGSLSEDVGDEIDWTIVGLAPGFVVGILTVSWVLFFHKKRRDAYFRSMDSMYYSLPFVTPRMSEHDEF